MLLLSLYLLYQGVSCFTEYLSNPYFVRQNTVLPWILRALPHAVRGSGEGDWVAWRRPWPHMCFKPSVQFNLPTWFLIPDPSLAPIPAGDWGAEIFGSFVNMILYRWLQLFCVHPPVIAKGVLTFSLPWLHSIVRVQPGLPSLVFRPLREKTTKNVSIGCDSAYHACPFLLYIFVKTFVKTNLTIWPNFSWLIIK